MSNPSGDKGREGEKFWLPQFRELYYPTYVGPEDLHPVQRRRLQGTKDFGDFTGVPFLHEAKKTANMQPQKWAREAKAKLEAKGLEAHDWGVFWTAADRRRDPQPLVIIPWGKFAQLTRGQCF